MSLFSIRCQPWSAFASPEKPPPLRADPNLRQVDAHRRECAKNKGRKPVKFTFALRWGFQKRCRGCIIQDMRNANLRFLIFQADDGGIEVACIDAGACGHGATELQAVESLLESVEAALSTAGDDGAAFFREPTPPELKVFDAVHNGRPASKDALKATEYDGKLVGCGVLSRAAVRMRKSHARAATPAAGFKLGRLELVGA